jgi:multidrug transporter EmrE-like cation transporter
MAANVLIAHYWLHEELYVMDVLGVFMIICGAVVISYISPLAVETTVEQMLEYATHPGFLIYLCIIGVFLFILLGSIANSNVYNMRKKATDNFMRPLVRRLDTLTSMVNRNEQLHKHRLALMEKKYTLLQGVLLEVAHSTNTKLNQDFTSAMAQAEQVSMETNLLQEKIEDQESHQTDAEKYTSWSDSYIYATAAGVVGALSVLLAGLASKTLLMAFRGINQFDRPAPYFFIGGMVVTIVTQTKYLNNALEMGDVMTAFPVFQAFWIGFGVIGGIVFYPIDPLGKDGDGSHTLMFFAYAASAVSMLGGCYLLAQHGKKEWKHKTVEMPSIALPSIANVANRFTITNTGDGRRSFIGSRSWGRQADEEEGGAGAASAEPSTSPSRTNSSLVGAVAAAAQKERSRRVPRRMSAAPALPSNQSRSASAPHISPPVGGKSKGSKVSSPQQAERKGGAGSHNPDLSAALSAAAALNTTPPKVTPRGHGTAAGAAPGSGGRQGVVDPNDILLTDSRDIVPLNASAMASVFGHNNSVNPAAGDDFFDAEEQDQDPSKGLPDSSTRRLI